MTIAISPREALRARILDALGITTPGVTAEVVQDQHMFHKRCELVDHEGDPKHSAAEITWLHREDGRQYDYVCAGCLADRVAHLDIFCDLDAYEAIHLKVSAWYLRYAHGLDV
ncbi:hypothetical protein [Nocardia carnea]|uniref:hypothetical protein n=1 Tax=Nocardia carnea TaxID=37328 RepID=UPI0024550ECB|nr:hypothetical protein [Nocardia carnea]